jgi:hypothetical protein
MSKSADVPVSFRFSADQAALLERMAVLHGGRKNAVVAALEALEAGKGRDWPAELRRLAAELEAKPRSSTIKTTAKIKVEG